MDYIIENKKKEDKIKKKDKSTDRQQQLPLKQKKKEKEKDQPAKEKKKQSPPSSTSFLSSPSKSATIQLKPPTTQSKSPIKQSSNNSINSNSEKEYQKYNCLCSGNSDKDFLLVCNDCNQLICNNCLLRGDLNEIHQNHNVSIQANSNSNSDSDSGSNSNLINEETIQFIRGFIESDKVISKAVDEGFLKTEYNHKINVESIRKQFQHLHSYLNIVENQILENLELVQDENRDIEGMIKGQLVQDSHVMNSILLNYYKQKSQPNDLQFFKDSYQYNKLLARKLSVKYDTFKSNTLLFDQSVIESVKESIKSICKIESKEFKDNDSLVYKNNLAINKRFKSSGLEEYYLWHGEVIPKDIKSVMVDANFKYTGVSLPKFIEKLFLYDGFYHSLSANSNELFKNIKVLGIGDIKKPLEVGSIGPNVKELCFYDGYSHPIIPGVIPETVESLFLFGIKEQLTLNSIPNGGLRKLGIGFIGQSLVVEKEIRDNTGKIIKVVKESIIPTSVEELSVGYLKFHLDDDNGTTAIPNTVKKLHLLNGFNHTLRSSMIPKSVHTLYVHSIRRQITPGQIPTSIKELHFCDGYPHVIGYGVIPNNLDELCLFDIKNLPTIPQRVRIVHLGVNFSHQISDSKLPLSVSLCIYDIKQLLLIDSKILSQIKEIILFNYNNYNHLIPDNIYKLIKNNSISIS